MPAEEELVNYFKGILGEAADEVFSDGMETAFSRRLIAVVENRGEIAVRAIRRVLSSGRADAEAEGEILRQMGSIEDHRTHRDRLMLLIDKLQSPDPRIRDAASLGLAALDDPVATRAVQRAVEKETSSQLRGNLQLVLDQLQSTRWQVS